MSHTENYKENKKDLPLRLILSSVPALFFVIFLWNFWSKGPYALGFNATFFLLIFLTLFAWVLYKKDFYSHRDLLWIIPMVLIAISYSFYDNPFFKVVNLLFFPLLFIVFYNQSFLINKKNKIWDFSFISKIVARFFSFLSKIGKTFYLYLNLLVPVNKNKKNVFVRVISGVILFLIISLTFFIPLLSSADLEFASRMKVFYGWFSSFISLPFVYRALVFIALTILFFSTLTAWSEKFICEEKKEDKKNIDPIISGIVLGGVLLLYLLFLWIQLSRLLIGSLPFDFKEVESLVKSGFWQLLFLSIINILIYFFTYKKTNLLIQRILAIFTITSLFLLFSAAYRMGLYVKYYGFSYEKFFASYTVIYCGILFIWLISRLFVKSRSNILKFLIFLFLWMYSFISIFPVERFILRTNIALSGIEDSRIRLFELTMLSPDVLSPIREYKQAGLLEESVAYLARKGEEKSVDKFDWSPWIKRQEKKISDKKWYEKNLTNLVSN
ncbi:MAG: DUF4153 domain-containing protein [Patescibacteria group bacterium]|nr:DUF4173 domain-containing protein [Patescibacteria group bacterium]